MIVHDPGGNGFKIERVWAFLAQGDGDDDEGVAAVQVGGTMLPLIAADEKRLDQLYAVAGRVARLTGKTLKVARFESRVDVDTIDP